MHIFHAFTVGYQRLRQSIIGPHLNPYGTEPEDNKLKLAFDIYLIFAIAGYAWLPYLFVSTDYVQLHIGLTIALVHTALLIALRHGLSLHLTSQISTVVNYLMIVAHTYFTQGKVSFVTSSWLVIISLVVYFIQGMKSGLMFTLFCILYVVVFSLLKIHEFPFPPYEMSNKMYYTGAMISISLAFVFMFVIVSRFLEYNFTLLKKISDSEIRLSTIIDNLPMAAIYVFKNKVFTNKQFELLTGYSMADFSNKAAIQRTLIPIDDVETKIKLDLIRAGMSTHESTVVTIATRAGEQKYVHIFYQKGNEYEIWLMSDITRLKETEQRLYESDYFIQSVTQALPHMLYIFDLKSKKNVYVNEAITGILGYSADEFRRVYKTVYQAIHPDDMHKINAHVQAVCQLSDNHLHSIEYRARRKDGEYIWLRSTEKIFKRDADGSVHYVIGIAENIQENKNKEEQLIRMNHMLKTINYSRNRAMINDTDASIIQLMADVGQVMEADEMVVYRYNDENPININTSFNQVYSWVSTADTAKPSKEDPIISSLQELLSDMLFSLRSGNILQFNQQHSQYGSLLQACQIRSFLVAPMFFSGKFWGFLIIISRSAEKTWLEYETGIIESFANTLCAAISKIKYLAELKQAKEEAEALSKERTEFLKSISHDIRTPLNAITGLINIMMQENITRQLEKYLKLLQEASASLNNLLNELICYTGPRHHVMNNVRLNYNINGCRILIVEDNEINAYILKKILASWNAIFTHVTNGQQVLQALAEATFDIILLDMMLPDIEGCEVARKIRLSPHPGISSLPIIAVTASLIDDKLEAHMRQCGINDYLLKPFSPDKLYNKLCQYWQTDKNVHALHQA